MKRIGLILSLVLLFGLCSCSSSTESTTTTENINRGGSTELINDNNISLFDGKTKYYVRGIESNGYVLINESSMVIYNTSDKVVRNYSIKVINSNHFVKTDDGTVYYIDSDIIVSYGNKNDFYTTKVLH